ncbi:MAG: tetratricopeptide repeat protein [Candidatus Obscuribacterales bacterium]|nr:tetratricopeptide repeat protein [Candidatus Obscuribacterales bacterium]
MSKKSKFQTLALLMIALLGNSINDALATKLNARPLPSERELKDFEDSHAIAPAVSRFARRMDYRDEEKLRKEQAEAARKAAAEHAMQSEQGKQKKAQSALEANNKGVALGKQGRFIEAIQAHLTAVETDPQNKQFRINLSAIRCAYGQERLNAKDYDAAAGLFRQALSAASDNGMAAKLLNETMKKQGKDPSSVEERVIAGDQLVAISDFEAAMVEYQIALQIESSARTYTKMGDVAIHYGQFSTAANWYRQALVKDPGFAPAHRQFGLLQLAQKDYTGAAASLRKAVIQDPKDQVAGQSLVEIWRRQVAANPLLAENHLGLAGALQLTGDFSGAESEYNKLQALDQNNPGLAAGRMSLNRARQHSLAEKHKLAAETLFNQNLRREALAEISQAAMMEPKNSTYQFLLGECLEANGDLRGAHQAYLTCVLIDPEKNKEAAYRMNQMQKNGKVQMSAGQTNQMPISQTNQMAQQSFQKNMFEGGNGVQSVVGQPNMNFSTHDESQPAMNRAPMQAAAPAASSSENKDPFINSIFAKASELEAQNNYQGAIATLRQVLTNNLQVPELHHRLAVDLLADGQITESISEFRIASALRPSNKDYAGDLARALAIHKRSLQSNIAATAGNEVAAQ